MSEGKNDSLASSFFSSARRSPVLLLSLPHKTHDNLHQKLSRSPPKKLPEIKAAAEQASALERRARAALEARDELGRAMKVAAKDALRLQASLPALEEEAREAEGQLEAFR